jgi:transposase
MKTLKRYSPIERERAVRRVFDQQHQHSSQGSAIDSIASEIGCTAETLRRWVRQSETDQGKRSGLSSTDRDRLMELEREPIKPCLWAEMSPPPTRLNKWYTNWVEQHEGA